MIILAWRVPGKNFLQMKSYMLKIAGYMIKVESADDDPGLRPSTRFIKNIVEGGDHDLLLKVHSGSTVLPRGAQRVFHAPLFEERDEIPLKVNDDFWSVYKAGTDRFFITASYVRSPVPSTAILSFSLASREWDLWMEGTIFPADPLDYPVDSLLLYYLTVANGDIMIHASGVNYNNRGYLFSGVSGKGKSTMAYLWRNAGATVIHDDRLIIRKSKTGYVFHNTPIYDFDSPASSCLNTVFLLEHGRNNRLVQLKGARAIANILANCIQHNWDKKIIEQLVDEVSLMCEKIPVYLLFFEPDSSVIDFILENEQYSQTY